MQNALGINSQHRSYRSSPSPWSCRRAFAFVAWARHGGRDSISRIRDERL